ncbi:variable surface protein Vir24g [Plasmodium vivax North Korean]|uniref:Variable surface protein Vir24g n=1 Tax=Plasmodium vivax North Korean TaxID=1035514 RepID=A0A0J9TT86_PLAVI|nr:variable surface protein Vir24g [Plasmodium vivax North Korean]
MCNFFYSINSQENILQKFSEYQIYEEFSSKDNCYKYCNQCKNIYIFEKEYPGISDFCRMLVRNLYEIKNKNAGKNRCGYLYYWIYENAWRVFGDNWNKIHGKVPIDRLFNIGYEIINELKINECFYEYDTEISLEEWREKKDLHDYFNNYKSIKEKIMSDKIENQKYCKYFIYIKKLYKKYIMKCCKYYDHYSYMNTCSDYFECDRTYYPNNFLCSLNCKMDELTHDSNKAVRNITTAEQKDSVNFNSEISTKSLDNASTQDSQESIFNELMKDPFYISSLGGFTLLGTFMVFFLFYKVKSF